jgi:heptosyltransferase-3
MNLLFVTSTRLGDAVLSTGLLGFLVETYPGARITIACGPLVAPLFRTVPGVERVIVLEKRRFSAHWLGLWLKTVGRRWRLVVDLRGSFLSYLLLASERRVKWKPEADREHQLIELARLFGLADRPPAPRLWFTQEQEALAARLVPEGGPILAMSPVSNWRAKTWRPERFAALAQALIRADGILPGARVMVLAGKEDRPQLAPVLAAVPPAQLIDLVGRIDILTAGAAIKRSQLFIGNDSGLMHMAAAVRVPTLGLFGPSRPEHFRPWGSLTAFVTTPEPPETLMGAAGWHHLTSDTLMDGLSVEAVEAAARELWRRVSEAG